MFDAVMVTGAVGQLGSAVVAELGGRAIPVTRAELDITDRVAVRRWLKLERPQAIINCAAYTNVTAAEFRFPDVCDAVNTRGVENLVDAMIQVGPVPFVQISTDYVFNGTLSRYDENEYCDPVNRYGRSKWAAERYILGKRGSLYGYYIVRTSGLFAKGHVNFVSNIVKQAREGGPLKVVNDQRTRLTYAPDLAKAIIFLLDRGDSGVYHIAGGGTGSWYDYACGILAELGEPVECRPISTRDAGGAPRPANSVLNTRSYDNMWGAPRLSNWQDSIRRYLSDV